MEKFMKNVKKIENGCWEWQGPVVSVGYGCFRIENKSVYAHRASWEIFKGEIPKGMLICHTCDNPKCVNPEHLFIGNHKDNYEDMKKKGRHPTCKVKKNDHEFYVENTDHPLKLYFQKNDTCLSKAAKKIGISTTHLHRILKRQSYPSLNLAYKIEEYTEGEIKWQKIIKPKGLQLSKQIEIETKGEVTVKELRG